MAIITGYPSPHARPEAHAINAVLSINLIDLAFDV